MSPQAERLAAATVNARKMFVRIENLLLHDALSRCLRSRQGRHSELPGFPHCMGNGIVLLALPLTVTERLGGAPVGMTVGRVTWTIVIPTTPGTPVAEFG